MREENARSKDKMFNKKTCNTSLHFSGREVNITSHNYAKREIGEEETEMGKMTTNSYRPSPHPISPNSKCQDNAEKEEGKKEENEVGRKTSKTRTSRLTPPPKLTLKFNTKNQTPKIQKFILKYLLKATKKSLHKKEKFKRKVQKKGSTHQDNSSEESKTRQSSSPLKSANGTCGYFKKVSKQNAEDVSHWYCKNKKNKINGKPGRKMFENCTKDATERINEFDRAQKHNIEEEMMTYNHASHTNEYCNQGKTYSSPCIDTSECIGKIIEELD